MAAPYPKLAEVRKRYTRDHSFYCNICGAQVPQNVFHAHIDHLVEYIAELETKIEELKTEKEESVGP